MPAGQVVAIVGLSGAGKTTLVNLIPRFYDVSGGAILIDGVDIRDVTLRRCASIGIVTQETFLFADTIAENIAYAPVGDAARRSRRPPAPRNAHDFILALPMGYDTRSASAGSGCRAASGSASPSRARCSRTRRSSSSTKPRRRSTRSRSCSSRTRWRT